MATSSDVILYRYTPDNMDEDVLRKLFVGREKFLEGLIKEIEDAARKKTPRFYLILGPRGIGKSHILVLLYYEIKNKLSSLIIPIKLAEEEYSVFRSSDLFLRILEVKEEETTDILDLESEDEILHAAVEKLKQISKQEGKVYTIFIENIHEVFRQFDLEEIQKLRSIFQKNDIFSVIASAPMIFPAVSEAGEPFFHFFTTKHLSEFTLWEIKELLMKIAEIENNKDFIKDFEKYEQKIHGMVHLTGGSPRLVILCYEMITKGELENIENAFFKIIDEHTPYYQEIFQLLTGQKRRIFDILISSRAPLTPKEISEKARIELGTVTTQLRRLEKDGYVISRREKKRAKYEVRERLFRLWREMRQPLGRKRISVMLEFLELWYTPDERKELFEAKFDLLEAGEKTALKDLCYYAEILPSEFKPEALLKLIHKLIHHGELEEAAYEIKRLKETAVKMKNKELDAQIALYEGFLAASETKHEEALKFFKRASKIRPKDEKILLSMGVALGALGRSKEAIDIFDKVLEINPKNAFTLSTKGCTLIYLNRHQEALDAINKALKIKSKDANILMRIGCALSHLGRYEEALDAINKALKIKPKDEETLSKKGSTLLSLGRYEEALDAINKALKINPKNDFNLKNKGVALTNLGRFEEGLEVFEKALEINPNNVSILMQKGITLGNLGKSKEALDPFEKALEINPNDKVVLGNKGAALGNLERFEEAIEIFDKVLALDPKNYFTLRNKGAVLLESKKFKEALDVLHRARDVAAEENKIIDTILILIKTLISLDKKSEAFIEIQKIKNKIEDQDADLIELFFEECLNLALYELKAANWGNGAKLMKMAFDSGSKLPDEKVTALTMGFLKDAANSGKLSVIKAAVDEIIKLQGDGYRERISPIIKAIEIIETRNVQKYYDLQIEEREIVADIVKKITKSDELVPEEIRVKETS